MAGVMAFACTRASINATTSLLGRAASARDGCKFERVVIDRDLTCISVVAPGAEDAKRTILYFHGGGHWLLTADTYRRFLCRLSFVTRARVIAVNYRKPPRAPFPAGLEDALLAWSWAQDQDPDASIAVAGDASGANLAFALVVKLAQMQAEQPIALVGLSPWLRLSCEGSLEASYRRFCADLYLGQSRSTTSVNDPLISPVNAVEELVRRFPPVLMHASKSELARQDVEEMAAALSTAGRTVETQVYPSLDIRRRGCGKNYWAKDSLLGVDEFLRQFW